MPESKHIYDKHYQGDYREYLTGFEIARWDALAHFIPVVLGKTDVGKVLDYGAGSGLYVPLWLKLFKNAELHCCDISVVALDKLKSKFPQLENNCNIVNEHQAQIDGNLFDVIVSVEVMEHVENLQSYIADIHRLLKPGGHFIWTTPCANILSIEHVIYSITGQIEFTDEGYRRWKSEAPIHVRRLKSEEAKQLLLESGFENVRFRFRSHFFSYVCTRFPRRFSNLADKLMKLDYKLFRKMPNGASMLGCARKIST